MYERLLKQTERYLGSRAEVVVPIKQVWDAMVKEGKSGNFAVPSLMADFECLLEGDRRFEFVSDRRSSGNFDPSLEDFLEHDEMEKLGFSGDQKVKLRRVRLPAEDDDPQSVDALDAAVSMEELDEELSESSLYDSGSVSAAQEVSEILRVSRSKMNGAKKKPVSPRQKSVKSGKKSAKGKSSSKSRKK
jgi:hypothetical protein